MTSPAIQAFDFSGDGTGSGVGWVDSAVWGLRVVLVEIDVEAEVVWGKVEAGEFL